MSRRRTNRDPIVVPPAPSEPARPTFTTNHAQRLRDLTATKITRKAETLRILIPLPKIEAFHADRTQNRVLLGGNRSSKSFGAMVEVARAVTGQDPYGKYPEKDGVVFVFGPNERHIGNNIFKKMFRPGEVATIRDLITGQWRAFDPRRDADRAKEKKRAPALIPPRFIKSIAWAEKKTYTPKVITLTTGWEIHFFSANAEIPRGQAIDIWWIDEETAGEGLVTEMLARSADRTGKGIWSATPQYGSNQLFDLCERDGDGLVRVHKTHILDNPYISDADREALFKGWTEDERRVRWDGEFLLSGFTIYPDFLVTVHDYGNDHFQPGRDWATYMVVDPGRQICGVLFAAIPPPSLAGGRCIVIYDELYIQKCDADRFGRLAAEKSTGRVHEIALIDPHAAQFHDIGGGLNVKIQYEQAFRRHGGQLRNGSEFTWACDDVQAGILAVRDWLRLGMNGKPYLRVVTSRCRSLLEEFRKYRYAPDPKNTDMPTDQPIKKNDHLMDDLRYLALANLAWRKPKTRDKPDSPAYLALQQKVKQKAQKKRRSAGSGPTVRFGIGGGS